MKTKYMLNSGLAFAEKKDMKKLENYASKGWLLKELVVGGLFYKMVEGPKQELTYTIDLQSDPASDYLGLFTTSGWQHVTSYKNQIHIFSGIKGTAPIYSGNEIEEGKYKDITSTLGKGALYALIALVVFSLTMMMSDLYFDVLYIPLLILSTISLIALIFCSMPYVMYKIKEKTSK